MSASRRDLLIETALDLFRRNGYQATGIEKILSTAGVSKPTLYRHFKSKEEPILVALRKWDEDSSRRQIDSARTMLKRLLSFLALCLPGRLAGVRAISPPG
jgi:AcrR family transcriptional regulator